jgi:hypothetical protein
MNETGNRFELDTWESSITRHRKCLSFEQSEVITAVFAHSSHHFCDRRPNDFVRYIAVHQAIRLTKEAYLGLICFHFSFISLFSSHLNFSST